MPDEHITDTDVPPEAVIPRNACVNYRVCGNTIPYNGQMCGECLGILRREDSTYDAPA
jgi:predicted nucleic acid-binding Zn ribbon protein